MKAVSTRRSTPSAPGHEGWSAARIAIATFTLLLLFLPLIMVILLSFNSSRFGTLPFHGTTHWYQVLGHDSALIDATWLTVKLSLLVTVTTVVLGTAAAVWLGRYAGRIGSAVLNVMMVAAVTVPWLILGIAMLIVANSAGFGRSYLSMYLGLVATTLPYVVFIVAARLRTLDADLENAASSLGASAVRSYATVTIPLLAPAIIGGGLLSFMISFNNFLIQYFLAPFGVQTLPLEIYSLIRVGYEPDVNALATAIVAITLLIVAVLLRFGVRMTSLVSNR